MKILVFAHKPPPHHGQSYMVQLLLDALREDSAGASQREVAGVQKKAPDLECYHLDARYSADHEDVGKARLAKVFLALKYSIQAIVLRYRLGVDTLYYVPAFPARTPVYRDWLVLGLCRPFFQRVIYHWHAVGLGEWLQAEAYPWERWLSRRIFGRPDLSVVLRPFNRTDAEQLDSRSIKVVPNGIPDPCPEFEREVLPRRIARVEARKRRLSGLTSAAAASSAAGADSQVFRMLFVSLCYSGKGLFDTVEAAALVHRQLKGMGVKIRLVVAGKFWLKEEQAQFEERIRKPDLQDDGSAIVEYRGFVSGEEKKRLFLESDCLCFPTRMPESFGLVLVEGMAFGLPIITTRWRNIPEMLPPNPPGIVEPNSPEQIAAAAVSYLCRAYDPGLRKWFLEHYTDTKFAENMRKVLVEFGQDN